eukprot:7082376-Pyramimonas_sp.AAC.1
MLYAEMWNHAAHDVRCKATQCCAIQINAILYVSALLFNMIRALLHDAMLRPELLCNPPQ